jgi:GNAT superfamily N-acetyltransferase
MSNFFYKIRDLLAGDIDQAMSLSVNEGWNQTENDWKFVIGDPDVAAIAALHNGVIIGTATAIIYKNKVAWIGMVVEKSFRGQGIGRMLLTNILGRLKNVGSVKLDATPAGYPLYQKLRFQDEYKVFRMINPGVKDISDTDSGICNIDSDTFNKVLDLDKTIFGADRSVVLNNFYRTYPSKAFVLNSEDRLWGYILGRDGMRFNFLGPVCASSTADAIRLISEALKQLANQPVALDVPEDKSDLIQWLESAGFEKQRHFVRMYLRSNAHSGQVENQYLISGPEFG